MTSSKPRLSMLIILKSFSLFEKDMVITDNFLSKIGNYYTCLE